MDPPADLPADRVGAEAVNLRPRDAHAPTEPNDVDVAQGDQRREVAPRYRQERGRLDHAEQARQLTRIGRWDRQAP